MKIHISETTKELLDHYGGFETEYRGTVEIKVWFSVSIKLYEFNIEHFPGKGRDGHFLVAES